MRQITNLVKNLPKITHLNNEVFVLLAILFLLQIADGTLTLIGVYTFGTLEIEGNPLVKSIMEYLGPFTGIFLVKSVACIIIGFVYNVLRQLGPTVPLIAKGAIYLTIYCYLYAVVVWIYILQGKLIYG